MGLSPMRRCSSAGCVGHGWKALPTASFSVCEPHCLFSGSFWVVVEALLGGYHLEHFKPFSSWWSILREASLEYEGQCEVGGSI